MAQLKSYADVQKFMDALLVALQCDSIGGAPHKAFWKSLSYQQFTTGNVPGVKTPTKILVSGDSASSNIVKALRGDPPFDGSQFSRMPADGPPYASDDQIKPLADWIDAGCPNA